MIKILLVFICSIALCSCTLNIIMTHTQGYADDVVDDTNEDKFDPELSIPMKAL